jgi:hypothetical protein
MNICVRAAATLFAMTCASAAWAQSAPATAAKPAAFLPAATSIPLVFDIDLTSTKARQGDTVLLSVAHDVMLGDVVVIPKGTPAHGVVTSRTGRSIMGRSGSIEFEVRDIQLGDRLIPVIGNFSLQGADNHAIVLFVTGWASGRSARFDKGSEINVVTADIVPVASAPAATATTS